MTNSVFCTLSMLFFSLCIRKSDKNMTSPMPI